MPRKTNVELVTEIMEFSEQGPLMQAFVIEALHKYSEMCVKAGPEKFESPFLNGESWVACARELKSKLDSR
jgi:hypothetical protein